jgi:hypothetical protein
MTDLALLLQHPDLAANIGIEVSGKDLLCFASSLLDRAKETAGRTNETYLTQEEVAAIVRRDRTTLSRWHSKGVLTHNSLRLYKQSDVLRFLER